MLMKYVEACQSEGMSKEEIREFERVFEKEKKRNQYQNRLKEKMGILEVSWDEGKEYDVVDENADLEVYLCYKEEVQTILNIIELFEPEDRGFLLDYFYKAEGNTSKLARMYNMTRRTAEIRIKKLIKEMRIEYFKINPTGETEIFKV